MAETRRSDLLDAGADPDRDSRVESLLVEGLDRYFLGRYEDAIHIWTRVLFLDRTHPRARAYIDRARTALAERQRRSDELLHASQALLEQGRTSDARELLTEAIAATGDDERAAALRMRLDRAERAQWGVPARASRLDTATSESEMFLQTPGVWWSLVGATALVTLWLIGQLVFPFSAWQPAEPADPPAVVAAAPVPVLTSSDVALVRARTLYARGRLADALLVLDRVTIDSELRPEADQLRVEIQRLLLAADAPRASSPGRLH
jgi:tetratricopeptide (TPR) repeat protein